MHHFKFSKRWLAVNKQNANQQAERQHLNQLVLRLLVNQCQLLIQKEHKNNIVLENIKRKRIF